MKSMMSGGAVIRCLFPLLLVLSACAPSTEAVQTAIAETQLAAATGTPIPPTKTPAPTATSTIVPTPTPDVRVLKIDPQELMLSLADLPPEGKYTLPGTGWIGVLHNQQILIEWGAEEGGKYINATGRVDGWWIAFKRNSSKAAVPSEVYDNVVLYQTVPGAQLSLAKYSARGFDSSQEVEDPPQVGDGSRAFVTRKGNLIWYDFYFSYRNIQHVIELYGLESQATAAFAVKVANVLLEKAKSAPLTLP
jgi:hypothetical protein